MRSKSKTLETDKTGQTQQSKDSLMNKPHLRKGIAEPVDTPNFEAHSPNETNIANISQAIREEDQPYYQNMMSEDKQTLLFSNQKKRDDSQIIREEYLTSLLESNKKLKESFVLSAQESQQMSPPTIDRSTQLKITNNRLEKLE